METLRGSKCQNAVELPTLCVHCSCEHAAPHVKVAIYPDKCNDVTENHRRGTFLFPELWALHFSALHWNHSRIVYTSSRGRKSRWIYVPAASSFINTTPPEQSTSLVIAWNIPVNICLNFRLAKCQAAFKCVLLLDRSSIVLHDWRQETPWSVPLLTFRALTPFVASNLRSGKVKHLRLRGLRPARNRREISTGGNHEASIGQSRLEILLEAGELLCGLGPWTTHWHRYRAFLRSDRSPHYTDRRITRA